MLTPKQIAALPEPLVALVSELENSIIQDLCRRIVKANMLTPSAEWQLYKASIMRQSTDDVMRQIAKFTSKSQREVKSMMTDTCRLAINTDAKIYRSMGKDCDSFLRSAAFSNAIKAGIIKTNKLMQNFTGTTAQTSRKALEKYLDTAYFEVTSGAFTYQQAITKAVTSLASDGIKCIKYASGRTDQVDVAVRRAVITSVGQTTGTLQLKMAEDLDCDLVQVTAHMSARSSHALWQGQVFSISGGSKKYRKLSEATGYGTGEGLKGWNCRHDFFPFFEGMSLADDSLIDTTENAKDYADSQRQRAFERSIRKSKRRLAGLDAAIKDCTNEETLVILHKKFDRSSVILKGKECKFKAFLHRTERPMESGRVWTFGFNKSVSNKVVSEINRRYNNFKLLLPKDSVPSLENFQNMLYNNTIEYKELKKQFMDKFLGSNYRALSYLRGKLTDYEVRLWYNVQDKKIPNIIDKSLPLINQAKSAFGMRNSNRTYARNLMKNQDIRKIIDFKSPNITFEEKVKQKMDIKHLSYEDALIDTIETSAKTNAEINDLTGVI